MKWYYSKDGEQQGPLSTADLPAFLKRGEITDDTLVWNETMSDWTRYGDLPSTLGATLAPAKSVSGPICSMCGKEFMEDELIPFEGSQVCINCKPLFLQQIQENSEISGISIMRYAGFWRRFGALFIDGIVMNIMTIPINVGFQISIAGIERSPALIPLAIVLYILMLFIPAVYMILMTGRSGATLGKKALGIKVVMADGSPLTYGRATGRYFAFILSGLILYIGYIMAAFDDEKRALHDHMCNTRVIYT